MTVTSLDKISEYVMQTAVSLIGINADPVLVKAVNALSRRMKMLDAAVSHGSGYATLAGNCLDMIVMLESVRISLDQRHQDIQLTLTDLACELKPAIAMFIELADGEA